MAEIWEEAMTLPPMHAWIGTCCRYQCRFRCDGEEGEQEGDRQTTVVTMIWPDLIYPLCVAAYLEELPGDELLELLRQRLAHLVALLPVDDAGQGRGLLVVDLDVEAHQVVLTVPVVSFVWCCGWMRGKGQRLGLAVERGGRGTHPMMEYSMEA